MRIKPDGFLSAWDVCSDTASHLSSDYSFQQEPAGMKLFSSCRTVFCWPCRSAAMELF